MYAIVRSGGRQHRVAVGEEIEVGRVRAAVGESVRLSALLLVDGETVTSDAAQLAAATITAEVVGHGRGPKIDILRYHNKTGYRRRLGHRQELTTLRVTDIAAGS
jgi:large subunit ribosomal protein L21